MLIIQKAATLLAALSATPLDDVPSAQAQGGGLVASVDETNRGHRSALGAAIGLSVMIAVAALNLKFILTPALFFLFTGAAGLFPFNP